VSDHCWVVCV